MEEFDARRAAMDLVTAFVSNNTLTAAELPSLLTQVFNAISGFEARETGVTEPQIPTPELAQATAAPQIEAKEPAPAEVSAPVSSSGPTAVVSIEESIRNPDFIISLITGEKLKTLKRHLRVHGVTEAEYRERYGLPDNYPFVAPSYSQIRRHVAQKMGLGRRRASAPGTAAALESTSPLVPDAKAATPAITKQSAGKLIKPSGIEATPKKARKSVRPAAKPTIEPNSMAKDSVKRAKASRPVEAESSGTAIAALKDAAAEITIQAAQTQIVVPKTAMPKRPKGVTSQRKSTSARKPKAPTTADEKASLLDDASALVPADSPAKRKRPAALEVSKPLASSHATVKPSTVKAAKDGKAKRPRRSKLFPVFS